VKKIWGFVPIAGSIAFLIAAEVFHQDMWVMRPTALMILAAIGVAFYCLRGTSEISPIHKGMAGYILLAALAVWIWPAGAGKWMVQYPASTLYIILFLVAVGPPLLGREVFTMYFARKTTPEAVWGTSIFRTINHHLTGMWAVLFLLGVLSGLVPGLFGLHGPMYETVFEGLLPVALMVGVGLPMNVKYPVYYQRKLGLPPIGGTARGEGPHPKSSTATGTQAVVHNTHNEDAGTEVRKMSDQRTIVAVNGSPHAGIGNTSMMIEMMRETLANKGFDLQVIHLAKHEIEYCTGCAFCIEKGKCWINDDHRDIVNRLLAADGIILACPVYFLNVTAQMKTFIDRSLAFGHKPRNTWKPGLAVSVSAGMGETHVSEYLANMLRPFGTFSVGRLTAMATGIGEFVGKEHVEARAIDLAEDLARAIQEKRRYPATDMDLRFYQFMGSLVKENKDTVMKHDHEHWQELGLYDGFEKYIQQKAADVTFDSKVRDSWVQNMIAEYKEKKKGTRSEGDTRKAPPAGPQAARTCEELLRMMPLGFRPERADGLSAVYQFDVSGSEEFVAHLRIENGECTFHEGPADSPSVVIRTPADVWLAIAKGEMDGQQAFMSGKYKVEGDLSLLMRLGQLFGR
jgi:multimeric flavodoxin WrbA/putative sterol carrier protein